MRIAILAPPYIPVPPATYGGTELFIAHLAEAISDRGHDVIVYANGESRLRCEVRWTYAEADWPLLPETNATLKAVDHCAWALSDSLGADLDVLHVNDALAVPMSRFLSTPVIHTLHHPFERDLSALYMRNPDVWYVAISDAQKRQERMPRLRTIHHGVRLEDYQFTERKEGYLAFLGRFAPVKGPHLAIEVARRAGLPLKLAGEIQPAFQDYWETMVRPHVDGSRVEYVGPADPATKNALLGGASALLFPIQWSEPFGLVMIEALACGTPVLALPAGSVPEIIRDGVTGWICADLDDMARRAAAPGISPRACRDEAARRFSVGAMAAQYEALYKAAAAGTSVARDLPEPATEA